MGMLLVSHVRAGGSRVAVDMEKELTMRDRYDRDQVEQYRTQEGDREDCDWEPGVPVVRLHLKLIAMACGAAFTVLVFILLLEMFFG